MADTNQTSKIDQDLTKEIKLSNLVTHTLKKDINFVYQENILCDYNLIVDKKKFLVHKTVLGARSTIFRALFESVTAGVSNEYVVRDMSCQTIEHLLLFLYTDTVDEDIEWKILEDLYTASVNYNVLPLQQKCATILSENLSVSNACDILYLSDLHKDDALKALVQNFILQHDTEIIPSDTWKNFEKQNIQLAVETMRNYFLRKANKDQLFVNEHQFTDASRTLEADLYLFYKDGILCDYKLETKEESFYAHKFVLGARSPVFRAMLESSMKEVTIASVFIEDLTADTVRKMLIFMYTGAVETVEFKSASQLYFAADKYDISPLKEVCSSILRKNLSGTNACEILRLADLHQDGSLKFSVFEYIFKHDTEIIPSEIWNEFQSSNSQLASETLRELYLKKLAL